MKKFTKIVTTNVSLLLGILLSKPVSAQNDMDAIMLNKHQFCQGLVYSYSSWDNYWEGKFKRDNQNIGTVSTQSVMYMPNYGITNKLNIMASIPYVWTKVTEGTLHGQKGVQDAMAVLKWKPISFSFGKNKISLFALGEFSTPVNNYIVDYLPLSIGMGTTNLGAKGMVDYKFRKLTVTAAAGYTWRSDIKIDRTSYYDTNLELTNKVKMPNTAFYQLRTGYRGKYLIAEAELTRMETLGGFDIRKNDMPFPSNRMNATMVGASATYSLKRIRGLLIVADGNYTVSGRNVGQATAYSAGVLYVFYTHKKATSK